MKILAIDLSLGSESISRSPKAYGGVGRTLALLRDNIEDFYVLGEESSFRDLGPNERKDKCIIFSHKIIEALRAGEPLKVEGFDLILHTWPGLKIKTEIPTIVWTVGQYETVHPENLNILCHNPKRQAPQILNPLTKIFEFVLGIELPEFQEYQKEDLILQVTNHYPQICSHVLAQACNQLRIKVVFAGPIAEGYPLLDFIDNKSSSYLGIIPEDQKIDLLKRAKLFAGLYGHELNETCLAFKQALSYGCGILTSPFGHIPEVIREKKEGFLISFVEEIQFAWNSRNSIRQIDCYNRVKELYSLDRMINSANKVFKNFSHD